MICSDKQEVQYYDVQALKPEADGLILWLPSDYDNVIWVDRSANGNDGLLYNIIKYPTHNSNAIGNYATFNGTTSYVDIPDTIQPTNSLTICCWIRTQNPTLPSRTILTLRASAVELRFDLATGRLIFQMTNSSWITASARSTSNIVANQWYYIAAVYDGVNIMLYVDNLLNESVPLTGQIVNLSTSSKYIGRRIEGYYYSGDITDVTLYNKGLGLTEIQNNYLKSSIYLSLSSV